MYVNRLLCGSILVCAIFASASLSHAANTNLLNTSNGSTIEYKMDGSGAVVAAAAAAGGATAALHYGSSSLTSDSVSFFKKYNLRLVDSYGNAAKTTLSTTTKYARPFFLAAVAGAVVNAGSSAFDRNKQQFSSHFNSGNYQDAFNSFMLGVLETSKDASNDLTFGVSGYVGQSINDYLNFNPKSPLDAYALAQAAKMKTAIDKAQKSNSLTKSEAEKRILAGEKLVFIYSFYGRSDHSVWDKKVLGVMNASEFFKLYKETNSSAYADGGTVYCGVRRSIDTDDYYIYISRYPKGFGTNFINSVSPNCPSANQHDYEYDSLHITSIYYSYLKTNSELDDFYSDVSVAEVKADDVKLTEREAKAAVEKYINDNLGDDDFRKSLGAYIGDSHGYDTTIGVDNTKVDDAPKYVSTSPFTPADGTTPRQYVFEIAPDGTVKAKPVDRPDLVAGSIAAPVRNSTVNNYTNVNAPTAVATQETPDVCALHPDSVGCMPVGNADYEDIDVPSKDNILSYSPTNDFQTVGVCPQPLNINILNREYILEYTYFCDFFTRFRPMFVLCGSLIAAMICFSAVKEL